jgi:hypothetical protein
MILTLISHGWKNPDRSEKYRKRSPNVHRKALESQFSGDQMTPEAIRLIPASRSRVYLLSSAKVILFLLVAVGTFFVAHAQETTGTIAGNVTDTSGAAVVGATVNATNTLTNTVRSTVTDGAGQYTLPSLPAGTYALAVEMTS